MSVIACLAMILRLIDAETCKPTITENTSVGLIDVHLLCDLVISSISKRERRIQDRLISQQIILILLVRRIILNSIIVINAN